MTLCGVRTVCRRLPASIKDIYHERAWLETSISLVRIKVVVEVSDKQQGRKLLQEMRRNGYRCENMSYPYNQEDMDASLDNVLND